MDRTPYPDTAIYLLPCCGKSAIGRLTQVAAQELILEGKGCWLSIEQLQLWQDNQAGTEEIPPTIIIDGCDHRCGARSVDQAGLKVEFHLTLSELGIEETDAGANFAEALILAKDAIIAESTRITMKIPMLPGCCC